MGGLGVNLTGADRLECLKLIISIVYFFVYVFKQETTFANFFSNLLKTRLENFAVCTLLKFSNLSKWNVNSKCEILL